MLLCPHCDKTDYNEHHYKATRNVESYGSSQFVFKCNNCKKKYKVQMFIRVEIRAPEKTSKDADLSF